MSDQNKFFQSNLDAENTADAQPANENNFFSAAQDAAKAAADANAAAEKLRQQIEAQQQAQQAQAQQDQSAQSTSSDDEEFVGSGGVGSAEQLDAIRHGYAERGIADPSGLGGSGESEA